MALHTPTGLMDWELTLAGHRFTEGSRVTVTLTGAANKDLTINGGEVVLLRTVTYSYRVGNIYGSFHSTPTYSTEVADRHVLPAAGRLRAGDRLSHQVELAVPHHALGTATGTLITVEWAVQARLRCAGATDLLTTRSIQVLSRSADRACTEKAAPVSHHSGTAQLTLRGLGSRVVVPGRRVSGILDVLPHSSFTARSVRIELVVRESVHHGPWLEQDPARNPSDQQKEKETVVSTVMLTAPADFHPGQSEVIPFRLEVPGELLGPSMDTPEFTISWHLRAVIDRPLHADPSVELEMHGVTSAASGTTPEGDDGN